MTDGAFASFLAALASSPPPYRPAALTAREVFGERYRIQRELGRGGMGTVYLAHDLELRRNVALKLATGRAADVELERLQQEARTMAGLSHPNIVTVFEAAEHRGHVYIAMEFVPGGTLRDWLDVRTHPWRAIVRMFIEVGRALAAAHDAGVVHRDFKPENVLLDLHGTPKIADFGLAVPATDPETDSSDDITTTVVGTPAYMAPEQALGEPATARSDQFSFCVALFEALASRRPYAGRTLLEIVEATERGEIEPPPRGAVPGPILRVLRRGLDYAGARRHPDMATLVGALRRVESARKRRLRIGGAGLGLVAAAALGFSSATAPEPCLEEDIRETVRPIWGKDAGDSLAGHTSREFSETVEGYVDALVNNRIQVCRAKQVEQSISETAFTLRERCLDRAQSRLAGMLADAESAPGPRPSEHVARWLPDLQACHDDEALAQLGNRLSSSSAFATTDQNDTFERFHELVMRAELQLARGDSVSGQTQRALEELADRSGLAHAKVSVLMLRALAEPDPKARRSLREQAMDILRSDPEPQLLAELALELTSDSIALGDLDTARHHLRYAEALRAWMPQRPGAERSESTLLVLRGVILKARGEMHAAQQALSRAVELADPDSTEAKQARDALAGLLVTLQQPGRASALYDELLSDRKQPARRLFVLSANAADAALAAGRNAEAMRLVEAAEEEADGIQLPAAYSATIELTRATVQVHREEWASAMATIERATAVLTPEHPMLADVADTRGALALARSRPEEADRHFEDALELRKETPSTASEDSRASVVGLIRVRLATDRSVDALELARRLMETCDPDRTPHATLAETEFLLARAKGLPSGRGLAESARQRCVDSSHRTCARVRAEARKFLAR